MDARELYEKSLEAKGKLVADPQGLSQRVFNALCRAGYGSAKEGLDTQKVCDALLNGTIWDAHRIGDDSVFEICEWIAEKSDYVILNEID